MPAHGLVDAIDELHRPFHGDGPCDLARDPDGQEQRIEAAFAHPRDVDVPVGVTLADIEALLEEQALRRVVVSVHDEPPKPLEMDQDLAVSERHGGFVSQAVERVEQAVDPRNRRSIWGTVG